MPIPNCAMRRCTFAAPLLALAAFTASDASARAASDCLAAPKRTVPPGSHWYYRLDREGQRKCWYVAAWKDKTVRVTPPAKAALVRLPTQPVRVTQQRLTDPSPVTLTDETAQENNEDRIRRLLYGTQPYATEPQLYPTEQPVEGRATAPLELRQSLAPVQTADAGDGMQPAKSAANALRSTPVDGPDEVSSDALILVPPTIASPTSSAIAPMQMTFYVIATLGIAGGLLHVTVKLASARRRRLRMDRRNAYLLAAPRPTRRALPPDRIRRFA